MSAISTAPAGLLAGPIEDAFPSLHDPTSQRLISYIHDPTLSEQELSEHVGNALHFQRSLPPDSGSVPTEVPPQSARLTGFRTNCLGRRLLGKREEVELFRKLHFHYLSAARKLAEARRCRGSVQHWREAEQHLAQANQVRSLLVESNLRLVVSIAKKYAVQSPGTLEELISCGNAGLMNAVDQFDYRRGFRFSTYAYTAIQRSIFAHLRSEAAHSQRFVDDSFEAAALLTKDASEGTRQVIAAEEAASTIAAVLHTLNDRELIIIRARFGFGEHASPKSFREIGDTLGLSKQRVGCIYHAAIAKLRSALAS